MTVTSQDAAPRPGAPSDADRIGAALSLLVRGVARSKERLLSHHGGGASDWSAYGVLRPLVADGPLRISAIADALHLNASSVSRHVTTLIEDGLVERRADAADGRACLVAPTPAGLALHDRLRAFRADYVADLVADWDPADRADLAALLTRLADAVEAHIDDRSASRRTHQELS